MKWKLNAGNFNIHWTPDTILCFCLLFLLYLCSFCLKILILTFLPWNAGIHLGEGPSRSHSKQQVACDMDHHTSHFSFQCSGFNQSLQHGGIWSLSCIYPLSTESSRQHTNILNIYEGKFAEIPCEPLATTLHSLLLPTRKLLERIPLAFSRP